MIITIKAKISMLTNKRLPEPARKILEFWFEGIENERCFKISWYEKWFGSTHKLNSLITQRFHQDLLLAKAGEYDLWKNEPLSALALIILLDQFSRNIYKGTPLAFANDTKALSLAFESIDKKHDLMVWPVPRLFFYLPLEHSETLSVQLLSVAKLNELKQSISGELIEFAEGSLNFAEKHRDVITRFGRFPSRNTIPGRQNSHDEIEFLSRNPMGF